MNKMRSDALDSKEETYNQRSYSLLWGMTWLEYFYPHLSLPEHVCVIVCVWRKGMLVGNRGALVMRSSIFFKHNILVCFIFGFGIIFRTHTQLWAHSISFFFFISFSLVASSLRHNMYLWSVYFSIVVFG